MQPFRLVLDHVQLAMPFGGEAEARAFYGRLLGLAELEKPEALQARGGVWFAVGAHQLHLGIEDGFAAARKAHPAFRLGDTAELHELAERLGAADVPVIWDEVIPDVERFFAADPWGNRLEFLASPAALRSQLGPLPAGVSSSPPASPPAAIHPQRSGRPRLPRRRHSADGDRFVA